MELRLDASHWFYADYISVSFLFALIGKINRELI